MKAELILSDELISTLASRVADELRSSQKPQQEEDQIISVVEAATMLGKSKDQIYQWVHGTRHGLGTFPYMKAGKSLRFSRNEVLSWMKRNGKR